MANTKFMTDEEYGKHIRSLNKKYYERWKARQAILNRKIEAAKISVSKEEIEAELKKKK